MDQSVDSDQESPKIIYPSTRFYKSNRQMSRPSTKGKIAPTFLKNIIAVLILAILAFVMYAKLASEVTQLKKRQNDIQSKFGQKDEKLKSLEKQLKQQQQKMSRLQDSISKIKNMDRSQGSNNNQASSALKKQLLEYPDVVEFTYQPLEQALPINPFAKIGGKNIIELLYKKEDLIRQRISYAQSKANYINRFSHKQSSAVIKYNLMGNQQMVKQAISQNEKEWLRLQKKFGISSVKQELPMCIISAGYNNLANFRLEANLNSILSQNYTNFKHITINDASTDGSNQIFRNYYALHRIDRSKYIYIENKKRITALQNYYNAAIKLCSKDSIVIIVDGDDEMLGRNTLQLFNWGYQTKKVGVLYSNFYLFAKDRSFQDGFTQQFSETQKKNKLYRNPPLKISHLRTARAELFHQINPIDLQDQGKFFTINADTALFFPLLELSCERVSKIQGQFNLVYVVNTGLNDFTVHPKGDQRIYDKIKNAKKYECYKQFDQRMRK